MAPIHRIEMYHDHPPPIPIKLKPKNLKKLAQGKGPVYVLLPNPVSVGYRSNFSMMPAIKSSVDTHHLQQHQQHQQHQHQQHQQHQHQQQRFRSEKNVKPKMQQQQHWLRNGRNSSNWIKHLTGEDDDQQQQQQQQQVITTSSSQRHEIPRSEIQLSSRVASMTIADVSPRFALKKILMLAENRQYRESANFINRLSGNTFGIIVHDLPVDLLIESMPQSLPIIESLYAKVFLSTVSGDSGSSLQFLRPDSVVLQMVKYFAHQDASSPPPPPSTAANCWRMDYCGPFISSCKKLLRVIVLSDPKIRKNLIHRRKALNKAIEGLGNHGLVGTSDENLMNLHKALQVEFHRVVNSYKIALSKLEELDLAQKQKKLVGRTVSNGPAPVAASHQRLLSLKQNDIQERLIKNKTLLNVVEPTLSNHSLDVFLEILQRRIELDKDVLFQHSQVRKETKAPESAQVVVAPLLMKFSHGCQQVLELMREVSSDEVEDEDDSSDVSGYHSDSDSTVMASGNSPFVPKSARYNFLSRSVRLGSHTSIRTSMLIHSLGLESHAGVKGHPVQKRRTPLTAANAPRFTASTSSSTSPTVTSEENEDSHSSSSASSSSGPLHAPTITITGSSSSISSKTQCQRCDAVAVAPTPPANGLNVPAQLELQLLKNEMHKANATISALQEREKQMMARLGGQVSLVNDVSVSSGSGSVKVEGSATSSGASEQRTSLIRSYGNLYAQSRVETHEWLDNLEQLRDADELKSKLLFSVIVLAFRSLHATSAQMKDHVRRILQVPHNSSVNSVVKSHGSAASPAPPPPPPPPPPSMTSAGTASGAGRRPLPPTPPPKHLHRKDKNAGMELEQAIASYLRHSVDSFDLTKNTEDVCSQIWATLYDYPCLQSCEGLVKYIKDSVRLAWSLVNQSPPFHLEYEARHFNADHHIRFHTSNLKDDSIKTYLWPALVEGHNGPCLHKAVVIT